MRYYSPMVRVAAIVVFVLAGACSGRSAKNDDAKGDPSGGGGASSGATSTGGSSSGGDAGSTSGSGSGGSSTGGSAEGGSSTGGSAEGGSSTGGSSTTGGSSSGGSSTGGAAGMGTGGSGTSGDGGAAGASECEGPAPGGCPARSCPDGQSCQLASGVCVPSRCDCVNGQWSCTRDCGGGRCVDTPSCTTPDPSGCENDDDCSPNEACEPPTLTICIPIDCACSPMGGEWQCREECSGGVCVPRRPQGCPESCEPQAGGFCGQEQVTWVCSSPGTIPVQEFMDGGCTDPFTQVPRYCCPPTFKSECF
jgi:hypothetical protein